jgi:hypothetical protein
MDRNNTSFLQSIRAKIQDIKQDQNDPLKYHQRLVVEYFTKYAQVRGLLLYHEMGSGKTILAAAIADTLYRSGRYRKVIFISNKILHTNFKQTLSSLNIDQTNYKFVTLNANNLLDQIERSTTEKLPTKLASMLKQESTSGKTNLERCVVIIDEAHDFFNGVSNGSKNFIGLYDLLLNTVNIKILFMTGTPIVNDPFELVACFNSLHGNPPLFSEDYNDFAKYFPTTDTGQIKNLVKFANRITGLVSYYSIQESMIKDLFPTVMPLQVMNVTMHEYQDRKYIIEFDKETKKSKSITFKAQRMTKPESSGSSYMVKSREYSNIVFPSENILIDEDFVAELPRYSSKFYLLLQNIMRYMSKVPEQYSKLIKPAASTDLPIHQGPGIVYSQFLDHGINTLASILEVLGLYNIHKNPTADGYKFCIISGEITEDQRLDILMRLKDPANIDGHLLFLLLISKSGALGVSTLNMMHVHIIEPYWNYSLIEQVIFRAARLNSHKNNPNKLVIPYIYLADPLNRDNKTADMLSVDRIRYKQTLNNKYITELYRDILKRVSIDCTVNWKKNCIECLPNNKPLFTADFYLDMRQASNCIRPDQEVEVKTIYYDEQEYYYKQLPNGVLQIYMNTPTGYAELSEDEFLYQAIKGKIPASNDDIVVTGSSEYCYITTRPDMFSS